MPVEYFSLNENRQTLIFRNLIKTVLRGITIQGFYLAILIRLITSPYVQSMKMQTAINHDGHEIFHRCGLRILRGFLP